jgi:putative tryptophan/tyrosine transport system substrate-binding protein
MDRPAGIYVDKIPRGGKPGGFSIEQPTMVDFVINCKTARALGLTMPESILQQATETIQ